MWQFENTIETKASADAIWRLYSDVSTWPSWDEGIEAVELHGPFEPGTEGVLTAAGQGPLPFRMVEATPERGFVDETELPGAVLRFIHRLVPLDGGGTRITHRVEIDGPAADDMGPQAGPQITAGIPQTMESLARHALKEREPSVSEAGGRSAWDSPGFLLWHATLRWQRALGRRCARSGSPTSSSSSSPEPGGFAKEISGRASESSPIMPRRIR